MGEKKTVGLELDKGVCERCNGYGCVPGPPPWPRGYGFTCPMCEGTGSRQDEEQKMNAVELIRVERKRQVSEEGWSPEHDDGHTNGELVRAAACYALPAYTLPTQQERPLLWPWEAESWKETPDDRVRELVKAGALIVAEIERLQRIENAALSEGAVQ